MSEAKHVRVVLLGPPGSGKGTQAERAAERFHMDHVSTGDLLRRAVRDGTELGRRVKIILDAGELVPDDVMGEVVEDRLRRLEAGRGVLLDGFPRTRVQVDLLDRILERLGQRLHAAVLLAVPEAEILRRLSGRRICRGCGATYHVAHQPPRRAGRCDACAGPLAIRDDDREDVICRRLRLYEQETAPVVACYRDRSILRTVAADAPTDEVAQRFQDEILGIAA